jgi:hypothetical protein
MESHSESEQELSGIDILDIYEKFANFFELTISSKGKIYERDYVLGQVLPESEWAHSIIYLGKRYSWQSSPQGREVVPDLEILRRFISKAFSSALREHGYWFRGKYIAFLPKKEIEQQPHRDIFRMYDGFAYRIVVLGDHFTICIDPHLALRFLAKVDRLIIMGLGLDKLSDFSVSYKKEGERRIDGYLLETTLTGAGKSMCRIKAYREEDKEIREELVDSSIITPEARPELIQKLLQELGSNFDVISFQRKFSFLDSRTPSRDRFAKTLEIVSSLLNGGVFPLQFGGFQATLAPNPLVVKV